MTIPGPESWVGHKDVDARNVHAFWFGKSLDEMQGFFSGGRSIQRGDELLFMPRRAFQFYIFAFAQYVMSEAAVGDADGASAFLRFLTGREAGDPGSVAQIYDQLQPTIEFVAESQVRFGAAHNSYGDFREKAAELAKLCGKEFEPPGPLDEMLDRTDDA
ncbi:MAG TPA: hypothetical protein VFS58_03040 [Steroidobacteraceae bacterium]|nr:hypothetical protein [Steroidobacteraceae bacterium]